jgi:hypothetical protein
VDRDVHQLSAPDGFQARALELGPCDDPQCTGCTALEDKPFFLIFIAPAGEDRWLFTAAGHQLTDFVHFEGDIDKQAAVHLRYAITFGTSWADIEANPIVGKVQQQQIAAMPPSYVAFVQQADVDELREMVTRAQQVADQVIGELAAPISPQEARSMLELPPGTRLN